MNTRTFTARSFTEASNKIKQELGEGAVILKSEKKTTESSFGLGGREFVEVTAADSRELKVELESGTEFANELDVQTKDDNKNRQSSGQTYEIALLRSEVSALRDQLSEIVKHFKYNNLPTMPEKLSQSLTEMTSAGIEKELATDLTAEALVQLGPEALLSREDISTFVIAKMGQIAPPAANKITARNGKPYKIALVGAPGAGKTSLLQKLATDPQGYGKLKIGLISLDTHRLAAIEQLKTFARVSGLQIEIVYQPKDVATALNKLSGSQIILIDSPGCSPGEDQRLNDLSELLDALDPDETHLVLNSTTRVAEQAAVARLFQQVGVTHMSLTRLDESQQPGALVTISQHTKKPLAWLSNGQKFIGQLERYSHTWLRGKMFDSQSPSFVSLKSVASHM